MITRITFMTIIASVSTINALLLVLFSRQLEFAIQNASTSCSIRSASVMFMVSWLCVVSAYHVVFVFVHDMAMLVAIRGHYQRSYYINCCE